MTELIELRPLKTGKSRRAHRTSYIYQTATVIPKINDNETSSDDDDSPIILNLKSKPTKKSSKRHNSIQTVPLIVNAQPVKEKRDRHEQQIQQFIFNTQPASSSPKKKEIIFNPDIEYIPFSAPTRSYRTIVERSPYEYRYPFDSYRSYELSPTRRVVRNYLPPHARRLVNRFIDRLEDEHDYDHSIDDCRACRRLRSSMDYRRRRTCSEHDVCCCHRSSSHTHAHDHSNDCKVCNLLTKSDIVISKVEDQPKARKKKQQKQVHIVESVPSKIKSVEQTTTTTTTAANPQTTTIPSLPVNASYYPTSYTTYADPYTGMAYAYDPYATTAGYDYSSYYTYPTYLQSHPVTNPSNTTTETTTIVDPNSLVDTGTYTYMPTKQRKEKQPNQTVIVHNVRNPTPPTPKIIIKQPHRLPTPPTPNIIIEQPRRVRLPRKIKTKTLLKERSTQTPHTTTTTYVQT